MNNQPKWLTGLLARNSNEVLSAVHRLCATIDRTGTCSANDIDSSTFTQKNAIGGAFQVLRSLGCVPVDHTLATAPQANGREIRVWGHSLVPGSYAKMRQFRDASRSLIVEWDEKEQEQAVMGI